MNRAHEQNIESELIFNNTGPFVERLTACDVPRDQSCVNKEQMSITQITVSKDEAAVAPH